MEFIIALILALLVVVVFFRAIITIIVTIVGMAFGGFFAGICLGFVAYWIITMGRWILVAATAAKLSDIEHNQNQGK